MLFEVGDVVPRRERVVAFLCHLRTSVRSGEGEELAVDDPVQITVFDLANQPVIGPSTIAS